MSETVEVEIRGERPKAMLLKEVHGSGREAWVPRKWIRRSESGDSMFVQNIRWEAAIANTREYNKKQEEEQKKIPINLTQAEKETDKAYRFDLWIFVPEISKNIKHEIWLPKSQIAGNAIPKWLLNRKLKEIESDFAHHGEVQIVNAPWEIESQCATSDAW